MDKIEKIRQEIERRRDICKAVFERESDTYYQGKAVAYDETLSFLDTLSEEPDKSLEEAAEEHYDEMWDELGGFAETRDGCYDIFFPSKAIRDTFIAGAEWQASQMPMPEDTVLFQKGVAEGRRLEKEEKDLGWHLSTEHPPVDEEVIVLLGRYEDFPQIAFGHIVDQNIAIDFNGWNIPGVKYWMPMPKLLKEDEK